MPHWIFLLLILLVTGARGASETPVELHAWLQPQNWTRDADGPVLSLGQAGQFDDTHIFAPAVIRDGQRFLMWYCGSQGVVSQRVFRLGLAASDNGKAFTRRVINPVLEFADGRRSVLTPALLRSPDGEVLRENGQLRMWFSATALEDNSGLHTLHQAGSRDGISWSQPSDALLEDVYAPTVIREGRRYRMWYVDVSVDPWIIRHAASNDGRQWQVASEPCLVVDQHWERTRLFYPTVLKTEGVYLMWYGSYWKQHDSTTATGFATSLDGLTWYKHPQNPVLRPTPKRAWESHYVTSQSVLRLPDGSFRIWYASRKKPPFLNKYFALNTALWSPRNLPSQQQTHVE